MEVDLSSNRSLYELICKSYNSIKSSSPRNILTLDMLQRLENIGATIIIDIKGQTITRLRISIYSKIEDIRIRYDLYCINDNVYKSNDLTVQRIFYGNINDNYLIEDKIHMIKTLKSVDSDLSYSVIESNSNGIVIYSGMDNYVSFCSFSLWHGDYIDNKDNTFVMTSIIIFSIDDVSKSKTAFDIIRHVSRIIYDAKYVRIIDSDNIFNVNDIKYTTSIKKTTNIPYSLF